VYKIIYNDQYSNANIAVQTSVEKAHVAIINLKWHD